MPLASTYSVKLKPPCSPWPAIGVAIALSLLCALYLTIRADLIGGGTLEIFNHLLLKQDPSGAWLALAILILALAWRHDAPITRFVRFIADHSSIFIALTTALLAAGTYFIYHNHPLSMDEFSPLFQARIFASGHLAGNYPVELLDSLVPKEFQNYFITISRTSGAVVGQYWPGFALLLTPFEWLGVPWLCNPILAGVSLWFMCDIATRVTGDHQAGGWALLLAVASPAFMANSISFYSMTAHLCLNLGFVWLLLQPTPMRALAAGMVGSLALVMHNPLPHMLFALPWVIWMAADVRRFKSLLALLAGYLPLALVLGLGWLNFRYGLNARPAGMGGEIPLGSLAPATGPSFITRALGLFGFVNLPDLTVVGFRIAGAVKLWIWAAPGLLVFAALGYDRFHRYPAVVLMAFSAVMTFLGYFLVQFDQGHGWGYRYFHSAWGVIPILAACMLAGATEGSRRLIAFVGAAAILSLVFGNGLRAVQIESFVSRHLAQVPRIEASGKHILMIDTKVGYYTADLVQNDPFLRSDTVRMVSLGAAKNAELMATRWPAARRISSGNWGELWQLGSGETFR